MLSPAESARRWMQIAEYTAIHFPETVAAARLPDDMRDRALHDSLQAWALHSLSVLEVPFSVRGAEHVLSPGPQIFFSNHQSSLDIFLLAASIPVPFSWLYKRELEWVPLVGQFLKWFGSIGIDRRNLEAAKKSLARAGRLVSEGRNLVVFPEGTRSHGPHLLPFKKGVFHLAIESQVPVVPVTLNGSWQVLGRNPFSVQPGHASVTFHEPIPTEGLTKKELSYLIEQVRKAIQAGLE